MIKTIIAYFLALFTGMFTQLVLIAVWPLLYPLRRISLGLAQMYVFFCYAGIGLLTLWWCTIVFGWFDRQPTILLVVLLALLSVRFRAPGGAGVLKAKYDITLGEEKNDLQYLIMFGEISGLVIGSMLLLQDASFF